MRGALIDSALLVGVVLLVMLATAHWWGPLSGRVIWRIMANLDIAGRAIFRVTRKMIRGQGRVRPDGRERG